MVDMLNLLSLAMVKCNIPLSRDGDMNFQIATVEKDSAIYY